MTPRAFPFSGVLLAGGRSSRMGRDKAWLPTGDGSPLWLRQWRLLESVGAAERVLACRPDQDFPDDVARVHDQWPGSGPLGAVVGCLETVTHPLLLALAVDLPGMTTEVLERLLASARAGRGAVFVNDGFFEPLAAVYPVEMAAAGRALLETGGRSLQPWIRGAVDAGLLVAFPADDPAAAALANINTPADLEDWREGTGG